MAENRHLSRSFQTADTKQKVEQCPCGLSCMLEGSAPSRAIGWNMMLNLHMTLKEDSSYLKGQAMVPAVFNCRTRR